MSYVIPLRQPVALPVVGTVKRFPVRRVYCIGRNYAAHAREMGGNPDREPPFFFMKPGDAVQHAPEDKVLKHAYPPGTEDYHHELELVAALRKGGRDIPADKAMDCVFGYAVGLDMTRRDLQGEAKKLGRPWEIGKAATIPRSSACSFPRQRRAAFSRRRCISPSTDRRGRRRRPPT